MQCDVITNKNNINDPPIYCLHFLTGRKLLINPGWKNNVALKALLEMIDESDTEENIMKMLEGLGLQRTKK